LWAEIDEVLCGFMGHCSINAAFGDKATIFL
jgi:hypothetical protein